jgi:hypothetical protein
VRTKPKPKRRYRLRNWREYNAALVQRGSLTLWCDAAALTGWVERGRTGRRGAPARYSALAITCMLALQAVFHLPLRATVGFVRTLLGLLGHGALPVAHASTLSRRRATLAVPLGARPATALPGPLHLVVDTTGLKVYGEGEWKVRQHGWVKHRTWVKLHLAVDAGTQEIRTLGVTAATVADATYFPTLLASEPAAVAQVTGDGAYEGRRCYGAVAARPEHPRAVFPPRRERRASRPPRPDRGHPRPATRRRNRGYSLHVWQHGNCQAPRLDRDEHVRRIRRIGRRRWKQEVGYHRRSLVETAISRLKRCFGAHVTARRHAAQTVELRLRAALLNRMTALGRPDSYAILA